MRLTVILGALQVIYYITLDYAKFHNTDKFVKINLRQAVSVPVLDVRTGTFLFPEKRCRQV